MTVMEAMVVAFEQQAGVPPGPAMRLIFEMTEAFSTSDNPPHANSARRLRGIARLMLNAADLYEESQQ